MSRIPLKYKLTEVRLNHGVHKTAINQPPSDFMVDVFFRVLDSPTWTLKRGNVEVYSSGKIKPETPVIFGEPSIVNGLPHYLLDNTVYEVKVTMQGVNGMSYIDSFTTNENMTAGESPIYLKQIYRGQQFTWFYDASPTSTDPLLNYESGINPTKQSSTWYYPLIGNFKEIGENWESFFFDENDPNQLFATKANVGRPEVVTQGRTFLGTSSVKLIRTLGQEPGWISSVEFFSTNTSYVSFNFYLEDTSAEEIASGGTALDKIIFCIGDDYIDQTINAATANKFVVSFIESSKSIQISNKVSGSTTSLSLTDSNSVGGVEYGKWYTLRLNFLNTSSGSRTAADIVGLHAFLYTVDDDTGKGMCVASSINTGLSTFWIYEARGVQSTGEEGWVSQQFAFGNPDNSTVGLTVCRLFKGFMLPTDVLDTLGSLASTDTAVITGAVETSYINLLKNIMFHKLVPNLTFTKTTSSGAVAPFREHVALQLGDTADLTTTTAWFVTTGASPKKIDIIVTLIFSVTSGYANQNELDEEVFIRGAYSKIDPNDTTTVLGTTIAKASGFNNTAGTLSFFFDCASIVGCGTAGRFHFEVVFKKGYITKAFTLETHGPTFQPTRDGSIDGAGDGLNYEEAFGALIKDNALGSRNGELVALTTFTGDRGITGSQISLNAMATDLQITTEKHRCDLKWLGSINPSTFNATVPPPPNQYKFLDAVLDPQGVEVEPAISSIVTVDEETIPVNLPGETFIMAVENIGYSQADDATIEVGFPNFVHPKMSEVTVMDAKDWRHDLDNATGFDINFGAVTNQAEFDAEKVKFFENIDSLHTQWGGYNGGVNSELIYFDNTDKSVVLESHGDKYPLDGNVLGLEKGPKDHTFAGYGAPAPLKSLAEQQAFYAENAKINPTTADPNHALSVDKIKRRRVGSILITKKYCIYGSFLIRMKLPVGMYGISPALWFFHYQEMYPTDPRWPYWIRRKATEWGNYLVVNNEIDMELPSQTAHGEFTSLAEVKDIYFDKKVLDDQYRISVVNENDPSENGTYLLKSLPNSSWNIAESAYPTENPNLQSSWIYEGKFIQNRVKPDMSNVKFNNWHGELANGYGWSRADSNRGLTAQEAYEKDEDYMAKLTLLSKLYADGEYHDWDIRWFDDRTELWIDGEFVRESRAFVPYNIMKYTFGLWFPSNREDNLIQGVYSWATDRGSWGGQKADNEVSQMRINRIKWRPFPDKTVAPEDPEAVDMSKLEYFSESFPEAGIRTLIP